MRRFTIPLLAFGFLLLFGVGCDALTNEERGTVTLNGIVVDENDEGVPAAFVTIMPQDVDIETDAEGLYSLEVEIDSTMDLTISARKNGYSTASTVVLAIAGREVNVPALRINATDENVKESGQASNIILQSISTQQVGVKEAGSEEIATITFQVTDSTGRPLSLSQATTVSFAFGEQPGGGEFLSPPSIRTDNNGEARVNLAAGTRAGVVQVIASTVVEGVTIRSNPAAMSIHGGHPDQAHFSLGPARFNFPGLLRFGETNQIAVFVGDQYSNPARPNTSVYFSSTHGIIQGSTLTSVDGSGSVTLFSGNPLPVEDGENGVATITATTADVNNDPVTASIPILFTGAPVITLTQTGSSESPFARRFSYTVTDGMGNPLGPGTGIGVTAGGVKVEAVGDVAVELGDTVILGEPGSYSVVRGPGITDFEFSVVEQTIADVTDPPSLDVVTITVSGPNGRLQLTAGAAGKTSASEGAIVERLDAKTIRVRAE